LAQGFPAPQAVEHEPPGKLAKPRQVAPVPQALSLVQASPTAAAGFELDDEQAADSAAHRQRTWVRIVVKLPLLRPGGPCYREPPMADRVLVVDDEQNLRNVLAATLQREGYEATGC